jgi:hypothetical protein
MAIAEIEALRHTKVKSGSSCARNLLGLGRISSDCGGGHFGGG